MIYHFVNSLIFLPIFLLLGNRPYGLTPSFSNPFGSRVPTFAFAQLAASAFTKVNDASSYYVYSTIHVSLSYHWTLIIHSRISHFQIRGGLAKPGSLTITARRAIIVDIARSIISVTDIDTAIRIREHISERAAITDRIGAARL